MSNLVQNYVFTYLCISILSSRLITENNALCEESEPYLRGSCVALQLFLSSSPIHTLSGDHLIQCSPVAKQISNHENVDTLEFSDTIKTEYS